MENGIQDWDVDHRQLQQYSQGDGTQQGIGRPCNGARKRVQISFAFELIV